MSGRSGGLAVLVVAAAALTGCVVPSPPTSMAAPLPVPTVSAAPSSSAPEPSVAAPSATAAEPAPTEPEAGPAPTAEECRAADEALAAIVTRSTDVLTAVPADGEPDWGAADAVVADLPVMRDAFIAQTSSPELAESFRELDQPIAEIADGVAQRDDLTVILRSAAVALAAPAALLPCAGVL